MQTGLRMKSSHDRQPFENGNSLCAKSILDVCDLQTALHFKKNHDCIMEITALAQEHFKKSLTEHSSPCFNVPSTNCILKPYDAMKKPYVSIIQKCFCLLWGNIFCLFVCFFNNWSIKVENCSVGRQIEMWNVLAKMGKNCLWTIQPVINTQFKSLYLFWFL